MSFQGRLSRSFQGQGYLKVESQGHFKVKGQGHFKVKVVLRSKVKVIPRSKIKVVLSSSSKVILKSKLNDNSMSKSRLKVKVINIYNYWVGLLAPFKNSPFPPGPLNWFASSCTKLLIIVFLSPCFACHSMHFSS